MHSRASFLWPIIYLSVFWWYAGSYKFQTVDSKNPLAQLETSNLSIKYLFRDLLGEIKGFKYQITVTVLLRKDKQNSDVEFTPALILFLLN